MKSGSNVLLQIAKLKVALLSPYKHLLQFVQQAFYKHLVQHLHSWFVQQAPYMTGLLWIYRYSAAFCIVDFQICVEICMWRTELDVFLVGLPSSAINIRVLTFHIHFFLNLWWSMSLVVGSTNHSMIENIASSLVISLGNQVFDRIILFNAYGLP